MVYENSLLFINSWILIQLTISASIIPNCYHPSDKCVDPKLILCVNERYRSMDGSCNNPINPTLGMAMTAYRRLLQPRYTDNISSIPLSSTGKELPSARFLSFTVFGRESLSDSKFTLLNMQWGQIVTHDTSLRMSYLNEPVNPIPEKEQMCCSSTGKYEKRNTSATCLPIPVPPNDPFFPNAECLDFDRSITDKDQNCPGSEDPALTEQLSGATHYLDLSFIYGNSDDESQSLRKLSGGKLMSSDKEGKFPPLSSPTLCANDDHSDPCYKYGDIRGNQNTGLTVLQFILLREHNRIANELAKLNPHWDDETLFQEARRINIAQYQHISYYEWNINFYGTARMLKEGLIYNSHPAAYVNDYNPCIDPRSIQAFQHSSFRYFHNQVVGLLQMISERREILNSTIKLMSLAGKPAVLANKCKYSSFVRGLSTQKAKRTDRNFDFEAAENFFVASGASSPELRAWDIQRDRDHGLASYNDYREFCGLRRARHWKDFGDFISVKDIELMRSLYESHNDVDLSIGGALERLVRDSLVGPTFLCLNLIQFRNLRSGDRYWFEHENQPYPFTRGQLAEIRKATVARLLCDNGDVEYMQPNAFHQISKSNPLQPCGLIARIDLRQWIQQKLAKS